MSLSRQVLRIAPIKQPCCFRLYSLISFVVTASDVDLLSYEWREQTQEFVVHLRGERAGLVKVSFLVQHDYPHLKVSLEALDAA